MKGTFSYTLITASTPSSSAMRKVRTGLVKCLALLHYLTTIEHLTLVAIKLERIRVKRNGTRKSLKLIPDSQHQPPTEVSKQQYSSTLQSWLTQIIMPRKLPVRDDNLPVIVPLQGRPSNPFLTTMGPGADELDGLCSSS